MKFIIYYLTTSIMNFANNNHKDLIVNIFCIIDDLLKTLNSNLLENKSNTNVDNKNKNNAWRKPSLSESEIIVIMIFGKLLWYKTVKGIYFHMKNYYSDLFKTIPSYKSFTELVNKNSQIAFNLLSIIMYMNNKNIEQKNIQSLYFIDSTKIAVCSNKRIFDHKVCKDVAQRWKSSTWWFYWFKLHIITDIDWNLIRIKITPWNTDDRNPVMELTKKLTWILVWDWWYVWEELRNKLLEKWIFFLTWAGKNMGILMAWWENQLLRARQIVETAFSVMKWSDDLVSSYARTTTWHFSRIIYSLLSYSIWISLKNQQVLIS